jgi:hypothetical protein
MATPQNPNDPKDVPRREDTRADPSRKGSGPNNPLPGEPGGPTAGFNDKAAEGEAKDKAKAPEPPKR